MKPARGMLLEITPPGRLSGIAAPGVASVSGIAPAGIPAGNRAPALLANANQFAVAGGSPVGADATEAGDNTSALVEGGGVGACGDGASEMGTVVASPWEVPEEVGAAGEGGRCEAPPAVGAKEKVETDPLSWIGVSLALSHVMPPPLLMGPPLVLVQDAPASITGGKAAPASGGCEDGGGPGWVRTVCGGGAAKEMGANGVACAAGPTVAEGVDDWEATGSSSMGAALGEEARAGGLALAGGDGRVGGLAVATWEDKLSGIRNEHQMGTGQHRPGGFERDSFRARDDVRCSIRKDVPSKISKHSVGFAGVLRPW